MANKLKTLDEVIGQRNVVKWFKSCLERDAVPQVIMLQGPAGIGKTSIAKIVACELACMNAPTKLEETKKLVIEESKDTDCVKLYNMSNLKSQEAVLQVKSDLSVGFSSTGRKVIIMDEAHGMSDEAQDSLLTSFENLQSQVYIIICSTELESFRDAFVSRCLLRRLRSLSSGEMREFLRVRIEQNNLKFDMSLNVVYSLISNYTGREPRRAINLLDSFEQGSRVSVTDLESFFSVYEGKELVTLITYLLTGKMLDGINFILDMDLTSTLGTSLLDIVRVANGGDSALLGKDTIMQVRLLVEEYGIKNLIGFTIDCTTHRLTRNNLSGYFLKWCTASDSLFKELAPVSAEQAHVADLRVMQGMIEQREVYAHTENSVAQSMSLESLLLESETVEDKS